MNINFASVASGKEFMAFGDITDAQVFFFHQIKLEDAIDDSPLVEPIGTAHMMPANYLKIPRKLSDFKAEKGEILAFSGNRGEEIVCVGLGDISELKFNDAEEIGKKIQAAIAQKEYASVFNATRNMPQINESDFATRLAMGIWLASHEADANKIAQNVEPTTKQISFRFSEPEIAQQAQTTWNAMLAPNA